MNLLRLSSVILTIINIVSFRLPFKIISSEKGGVISHYCSECVFLLTLCAIHTRINHSIVFH